MCGRFVSASSPATIAEQFDVTRNDAGEVGPDYNVAPRAEALVIRERDTQRVLSRLRWGLVPSWAQDPKVGDRQINARAEGIADKPAFRRAFARKRCIVPADGFYEWMVEEGRARKQPVYVHARDGKPLALAGLWEIWKVPEPTDVEGTGDGWLRTFTIVTTTPNELLAPVHDRMPVILPEATWDSWLDPANHDTEQLRRLLVPSASDALELWPVSTAVNSADNNSAELLRPVGLSPS